MLYLTKVVNLEIAHHLPDYDGKCRNIHGHRIKLEITICGQKDETTGMIMDFKVIKEIIQRKIVDLLDHKNLNDFVRNPTAENVIELLIPILRGAFPASIIVHMIKLWETEDSCCVWVNEKQ